MKRWTQFYSNKFHYKLKFTLCEDVICIQMSEILLYKGNKQGMSYG